MFTNVLVGVDGRQGGSDAIALARQLASPDATITLANIYGSGWLLPRGIEVTAGLQRDDSERMLVAQRAAAGIDAQIVCAWNPSPGRGLHELAEHSRSDLIVVGSSRRALLGRALIGDDTRESLNGAPCAIAVAPRAYTQTRYDFATVGVGYDGSAEGEAALAEARQIAERCGASIEVLWVVSLQDVREDSPIPADWPTAADELVGHCREKLERLDGVKADAVYGGPKEELSRLGDRVDLLILGSRSYGPLHHVFHGTTSTYLTRHVGCPILQLPRRVRTEAREATEQAASSAAMSG
ncbi:MAG: universal stress protein [Solirubrobacteraceae bacterium]